jgi:hypothetical protein
LWPPQHLSKHYSGTDAVLLRPGSCFHAHDGGGRAYTAAAKEEWGRPGRKPVLRLGQRGEAFERAGDGRAPEPVGGQVQREPAGVAGQLAGDVQQSVSGTQSSKRFGKVGGRSDHAG